VSCGDLVLQLFDGLVLEFDNRVATGADQVIVVLAGQYMFVARLPVVQQDLTRQACLDKELEGAVDGGLPYPGVAGLDLQLTLFATDLLVGRKEYSHNAVSLARGMQPLAGGKHIERPFFFLDHPAPLLNLIFNIKIQCGLVNPLL